jgi:hypothetical protein
MMKKNIVLLALIMGLCLAAFAQEKKLEFGLGAEWNMDSREDFSGGAVANIIYNLPGLTSLGLSFTGSYNFNGIYVLEPGFLIRHYFSRGYTGFFVQFDGGLFIAMEDRGTTRMIMAGLRGGYRWQVDSHFYIEPYGRLGYPFAFGIGAMTGIRF